MQFEDWQGRPIEVGAHVVYPYGAGDRIYIRDAVITEIYTRVKSGYSKGEPITHSVRRENPHTGTWDYVQEPWFAVQLEWDDEEYDHHINQRVPVKKRSTISRVENLTVID